MLHTRPLLTPTTPHGKCNSAKTDSQNENSVPPNEMANKKSNSIKIRHQESNKISCYQTQQHLWIYKSNGAFCNKLLFSQLKVQKKKTTKKPQQKHKQAL